MSVRHHVLFTIVYGIVLVSGTTVDRICQCSINSQCFSPQQVALYNVERCYQLACLPSSTGTRMAMQHVAPCGQCCEHGGSLVASGQSVLDQQQGCTITCNGGNRWTSCGGGGGSSSDSGSGTAGAGANGKTGTTAWNGLNVKLYTTISLRKQSNIQTCEIISYKNLAVSSF